MSRVVLITGCSSGFGRAMVPAFLDHGWHVIATMRRAADRSLIFDEELRRFGNKLTVLNLDVTSASDRSAVIEAIGSHPGRLDCLINNAGFMQLGAFEDITEEQLRYQFEVNFFGAVFLTHLALPLLRKSRGVIINHSSVFGFLTWPLTSGYCSSKYALEGASESLAQELRPHGVRVVLLETGAYVTTQLPANAKWGTGSGATYAEETACYRRWRESGRSGEQGSLSEVTAAALRAAEGISVLRYRVGRGMSIIYRLTRWFPETVGFRLIGWGVRRVLCRPSLARLVRTSTSSSSR